MTVAELIAFLKLQPQDMEVAIEMYSEQCLFDASEIKIEQHCVARPDGWIECARPDKPLKQYLVFPGN